MTTFGPELTWLDGQLQTGLFLRIEDRHIAEIRPAGPADRVDHRPHVLMPACTDMQVNGAGGVMLNSDPTAEAISQIVATQRRRGTGWVMPTLITTAWADMVRAADAARAAWGLPGFLGLHFEGPYLNPARRGTHAAAWIRPFEPAFVDLVADLRAAGIPVLVTLAPECMAPGEIARLVARGAVVSAGHSEANLAQTNAALAAGLGAFTHLMNAMPPMQSRAPGIVAAALRSDAAISVIADGHHVAWEMLALAYRARPEAGRMILVSDAMATIGGPDHFELYGERITLRDGRLVNAAGALAGAHVDVVTCLRNMVQHVGVPLAAAIEMATDTPQRLIGCVPPQIAVGMAVDEMLCLDRDLSPIPV